MLRSFSRLNLPIRGWKLEVDFGEGQKVGQEVWEVNPENYHQSLASRTFFRGLQNKKRKTAQRTGFTVERGLTAPPSSSSHFIRTWGRISEFHKEGRSSGVLVKEFVTSYSSKSQGCLSPLPHTGETRGSSELPDWAWHSPGWCSHWRCKPENGILAVCPSLCHSAFEIKTFFQCFRHLCP